MQFKTQSHQLFSLNHVKWDCTYHIIFTPKYRKKILYGQVRKRAGEILRTLCRQKQVDILEGYAVHDHIHMVMKIPPKYSIAMVVGFIKGKSAIQLHREFGKQYKSYYGKSFWSRGYYVSTVGLDEEMIKQYVRDQEKHDQQADGDRIEMKWA